MSDPGEIKAERPEEQAQVELTNALSALAMPPERREDAHPDDVFLIDTDRWVHHAAEHIRYALKLMRGHH